MNKELYQTYPNVILVPLYNKHNVIVNYSVIDQEDENFITRTFRCDKGRYAKFNIFDRVNKTSKPIYLHRLITNAPEHLEVDHINGDGLDNRKSNLRLVTHAQNLENQKVQVNSITGYKNISYCITREKYVVQIKRGNKHLFRKRFNTLEEAISHRDQARLRLNLLDGNQL